MLCCMCHARSTRIPLPTTIIPALVPPSTLTDIEAAMAPVAVVSAQANLLVATKRTVARPFSKKASLITLRK